MIFPIYSTCFNTKFATLWLKQGIHDHRATGSILTYCDTKCSPRQAALACACVTKQGSFILVTQPKYELCHMHAKCLVTTISCRQSGSFTGRDYCCLTNNADNKPWSDMQISAMPAHHQHNPLQTSTTLSRMSVAASAECLPSEDDCTPLYVLALGASTADRFLKPTRHCVIITGINVPGNTFLHKPSPCCLDIPFHLGKTALIHCLGATVTTRISNKSSFYWANMSQINQRCTVTESRQCVHCMLCRTVQSSACVGRDGKLSQATVKWQWVPDWKSNYDEGFHWQR